MQSVVSFFIRRKRVATLVIILVLLAGSVVSMNIRRQGDPTVSFDVLKITTVYPGASPEDVEINVTEPLEDEISEVEDIDELKSMSMEGISLILVFVDPDAVDVDKVKDSVREAVNRVSDMPAEVTERPKVEEIRSSNVSVLEIAVQGDVPEIDLRRVARDLEKEIKDAQGVGLIEKIGYRKREIHIEADMSKLEERHVSLNEIMDAISARNVRVTGGSLESYVSEKKIVTFAEYMDPMEVEDVVIRSTFTGQKIRITDIAGVYEGFEEHEEIARTDGNNCITLLVRAQENADVIDLSSDVRSRLERFREGLPEGVTVSLVFDTSEYTKSLLSVVKVNAVMGFILVIITMCLFLDFKSAFWTAFGIPIAVCASLLCFPLFGNTINMVSLGALVLVLGMLVDHAIVIAENIYRFKEQGMDPVEATLAGVREVYWPVLATVMTTILAFVPMFFMSGLIGKFVYTIPVVVILMLVSSFFEATTILPCHLVAGKPPKERKVGWIDRLSRWYRKQLVWCLKRRAVVMCVFAVLLIITMTALSTWVKFILFPQQDPDIFHVVIEAPPGMPIEQTSEKVREVERLVREVVPQEMLRSFSTRIGHHDTDIYGGTAGRYDNWALVTINLRPAEERDEPSEAVIAAVSERVKELDGYGRIYVETAAEGPPVGKPITVTFTSDGDELRKKFEDDLLGYLRGVEGVFGIESNNIPGKEELRLKLDYDHMARLGLTALDVSKTVRTAFEGQVVTSLRRGGEEIDFRVRLRDPKKYRAEGVLDLVISNKLGKLVPLSEFAHFEETQSPSAIHHYEGSRSVTITGEVDTEIITSAEINRMVSERFEPLVSQNAGIKMKMGGEEEKTQKSMEDFFFALAIALVAIYFLLVVQFDSYAQPFIIMAAVPFGLMGVVFAFITHGLPLGFLALIGILGLTGVVVNDSLVMVSYINQLRDRAGSLSLETIVEGALTRLRPVLLTTITTAAGLMPTAYGIGGDVPFLRPMVLAMAWGLIFATVITLIFVPTLYAFQVRQ